MSTFVHNETNSLAIIQETGLPKTFYKAIEYGIEPAIEVGITLASLMSCLGVYSTRSSNPSQMQLVLCASTKVVRLSSRNGYVSSQQYFPYSPPNRHLKVLIDKENAVIIGTAVDELIQHHPSLKIAVFDSLRATLSRIEDLGASYVPPADIERWYHLMPTSVVSHSDGDVVMQDETSDNVVSL